MEYWALTMHFINHAGVEIETWWPVYQSYEECRYWGDMLSFYFESFHDAKMTYALCFRS